MTTINSLDSFLLLSRVATQMDESLVVISAHRGYAVAYVNDAFTRLTGFEPAEIVGRSLAILRGPLTDPLLVSRLKADLDAGRDSRCRLVAYKKNGDPLPVDLNIRGLRDAAGKASHFYAVHRDGSREDDLRDKEQRLRQTIEQINRPVVYFDLRGRVVDANPALENWISAPPRSVFGRSVWTLPGGPRRREDLRWARTMLAQGKPWTRQYETWLVLDGVRTRRLVASNATPLTEAGGRVVGYVAVGQDVTEKARLEGIAAASNLNDTLGMVFASLRHELGNPVNSLKAALEVIASGSVGGDKLARYHSLMQQQVERMGFLLEHMRSFGQFDRLEMRQLELDPLLAGVQRLLESALEKRGARLEWNVPPGLKVWADSHALIHVFVALLDNAAAAVADNPPWRRVLRVDAFQVQASQVTIEIKDQGRGFPPGDRERIFAPFYTSRTGGTGLGLAIARRLTTQMGGTITAQAELGKGATFTLILDRSARGRA
jgi:PAS domain S-box-containing protein